MLAAIDWNGFWPGLLASLIVGIALWMFLPRGVSLTKSHPVVNAYTNEVVPDTWLVTNTSPIPALVVGVFETGIWLHGSPPPKPPLWRRAIAWAVHTANRPLVGGGRGSGRMAWSFRLERVEFGLRGRNPMAALSVDGGKGTSLTFQDEVLETRRTDRGLRWRGLVIPPGESLTAHVGVNAMLKIRYRRAGPLGVLERRSLIIFGTS